MKIVGKVLVIRCECGKKFRHRVEKEVVRCPWCFRRIMISEVQE